MEIEFHDGHAAVNVKVYNFNRFNNKLFRFFERIGWTENQFYLLAQDKFDTIAEIFWQEDVQEFVKETGVGDTVYSEGRSGGWAVPTPYLTRSDLVINVEAEEEEDNDFVLDRRNSFLNFQRMCYDYVAAVPDMIYEEMKNELFDLEDEFLLKHSVTARGLLSRATDILRANIKNGEKLVYLKDVWNVGS